MRAWLLLLSLSADAPQPRVPEGFTVEVAAAAPLVKHPMMAGFDDRGRLYVAESAGHNLRAPELLEELPNFVRRLEDTDGDGVFDKSTIFADKLTLPMGALWYRGSLYVASPPHIWRLTDTDDDGVADERSDLALELKMSFGFTGNAASIHGCFLDPCGRIFWCDGRHGHEFVDEQGRVRSTNKASGIFSCSQYGREVELFCGGGMDNPVEIDFTETGEMLGSVNILLSKPRVDCLMHWVEGGVYPHKTDVLDGFQRTGELMPPMTRLGHIAVSGLTRYRSGAFGDEYTGNVFTTVFNQGKLLRSVVTRSGATFTTREEDFLTCDNPDFHPTDVIEDADGSLLLIDTGGWFRIGCPTSQVAKPEITGAIYRIRKTDAKPARDPRGLELAWDKLGPPGLIPLLDDPRFAVRERAVDRLAEVMDVRDIVSLSDVILQRKGPTGETARRNAIWAMARFSLTDIGYPVVDALDDSAESVRLAAAYALGVKRDANAVSRLCRLVVDDTPAVRRSAATALGRICESAATVDTLRTYFAGEASRSGLEENAREQATHSLFASLQKGVTDRVLEHALIYAVIRIAERDVAAEFLTDPNPLVRRAALIALDQMVAGNLARAEVLPLLDTDDPDLQAAALEVISRRDGWAAETRNLLQQWLAEDFQPERASIIRGFLVSQAADAVLQGFVAKSLTEQELAEGYRLALLEVLEHAVVSPFPEAWRDALGKTLQAENATILLQAIRVIESQKLTDFDEILQSERFQSPAASEVQVAALHAVMPRLAELSAEHARVLAENLDDETPPLIRLAAARAFSAASMNDSQLRQLAERLPKYGALVLPTLVRCFADGSSEEIGLALVAVLRKHPAANAARGELAEVLKNYPPSVRAAAEPLLQSVPEDQARKLQDLAEILTDGDANAGQQVFLSRKAACASCHAVGGSGGRVGPDLTKIGSIRTPRDLLEAVVLPSASFARDYRPWTVLTADGLTVSGLVTRQTAEELVLRTTDLKEVRLRTSEVEQIKESDVSIMPQGLDTTLSREELRDLLAYLASLR